MASADLLKSNSNYFVKTPYKQLKKTILLLPVIIHYSKINDSTVKLHLKASEFCGLHQM